MAEESNLQALQAEAYRCLRQIELWNLRLQALNRLIAEAEGEIPRLPAPS